MILLLAGIGTLLAGIFVSVYVQKWPPFLLGIVYKRVEEEFFGPRLLTFRAEPPSTPPIVQHVREATERIDVHRFQSITQALQLVRTTKNSIPIESLTIIAPLVLSLVLTRLFRFKRRRSSSNTSVDSLTSCRSSFSQQEIYGAEKARSRCKGGPTLRAYGVGRRRRSSRLPSVEFPALVGFEPGENEGSYGTDDSSSGSEHEQGHSITRFLTSSEEQLFAENSMSETRQELNTTGRLKRWLRNVIWNKLCRYHTTTSRGGLDGLSVTAGHNGRTCVQDAIPRPQTPCFDGGRVREDPIVSDDATHASAEVFETCFVEEIYCRRSDASEVGTDEDEVVEGYERDCDQPPEHLDWQYSHRNPDNGGRSSGSADCVLTAVKASTVHTAELYEINKSGISERSSYLGLPENERSPKDAPSGCSFDRHQQEVWPAAADTVVPYFSSLVEPPQVPQQSQDVFDQLLEACRQREAVTFSEILQHLGAENCVKLHESEHVDIFRVCGVWCSPTVLKVFDSSYIAQRALSLCNEIKISWYLNALVDGTENQTAGFSQLQAAHCTWERYPKLLSDATANYVSEQGSTISRQGGRMLCPPYVVLCMPFAGEELSKVKFQNILQLRSVIQQVALTVAVGEAELEFEHRALTSSHVLVKAAQGCVARFRVMKSSVYVDLHGIKATIVDFAASRLCAGAGSMPLYTELDELSEEKKRGVGERLTLIKNIVRPKASHFHPYTNAVFLHDLIHELLEVYEPIFEATRPSWTEPECEAWRDLALWSEEISCCSSAMDFVVARVLRSVRFAELQHHADED